MTLIVICVAALGLALFVGNRIKRARDRRELELHSIEPEALHELMAAQKKVRVFDVRQPLDLLAYSEVIPGATRVPPKDVMANPSLIPGGRCGCLLHVSGGQDEPGDSAEGFELELFAAQDFEGRAGSVEGEGISGGAV